MSLEPFDFGSEIAAHRNPDVAPTDPLWRDAGRKTIDRMIGRIPVLGDALLAGIEVREERALERRLRFLEDAAHDQGVKVATLVDHLTQDEGLNEFFWRAWNAAGEARSNEKIRILAAAVSAVCSGERLTVSSGHVLLGVVEALEPIHLQTLVDIDRLATEPPPIEEGGSDGVHGARRPQLEFTSTLEPEILGVVIADLEAKRLIANAHSGTYGGLEGREAFVLTTLGDQICQLLLSVAEDEPEDPSTDGTTGS